ncbi:HMG1/2-like protein isoform X1 [Tasmannia lanceolata]|uniref:HMG1/2-like protein isoform X1 n=1 Tax=Tasmannia lanceolata TaxID=3420 RepID=UPI0040642724
MKGAKSKAETAKKAESKLSVKSKGTDKASKKPVKKGKAGKDPNKPKRPPSAFFVFMAEFREQFKEKNPHNKSVAAVGKAAGDKWKSMSEADKAPYVAKATKKKTEYNKTIAAYNKKQSEGPNDAGEEEEEEEESDKSKSEEEEDDE